MKFRYAEGCYVSALKHNCQLLTNAFKIFKNYKQSHQLIYQSWAFMLPGVHKDLLRKHREFHCTNSEAQLSSKQVFLAECLLGGPNRTYTRQGAMLGKHQLHRVRGDTNKREMFRFACLFAATDTEVYWFQFQQLKIHENILILYRQYYPILNFLSK